MRSLKKRLQIQREERQNVGFDRRGKKLNLVFVTSVGTPLDRVNVRRQFLHFLAKAGRVHARFYDLRHTGAALLLAQGAPLKIVFEILGRTTIQTTADLYTHLSPPQHPDAATKMDDVSEVGQARLGTTTTCTNENPASVWAVWPRWKRDSSWSGWPDSNGRPPAPHTGALPDCATPRMLSDCTTSGIHRANRNQKKPSSTIMAAEPRMSGHWKGRDSGL